MNLNYPYDKASVKALTLTADKEAEIHTLVIDFDGEVVLNPQIHFPAVPVTRYMFCMEVRAEDLKNDVQLASLYDALEEIFNGRGSAAQKYIGLKTAGKIAA